MTSYYNNKRLYYRTAAVLRIKYLLILSLLLAAAVFVTSCSEKSTTIGIDLLPPGDFTFTKSTDTVSVFSYTYTVDSVRTDSLNYSYLGGLYDPYFGTSSTSFVAQLRLLKDFQGGPEFHVDSVKLLLTIAGAKGVIGTQQQIRIYEIKENLSSDLSYYSNRDPHVVNNLAMSLMPVIKKDSSQAVIINLPVSMGEYLMRDTAKLFQDNDHPESDFRSIFNGIYCEMVPFTINKGFSKGTGTDSLMLMAITFDQSEFVIRVYYHNLPESSFLYYDFTITGKSARYNLYSHDISTAEPGKKINHVDDNVRDTVSYLQGFNGVYTKIRIPALDSIKKLMPVSVNKATLTIPVFLDDDLYKTTTLPAKIYMSYETADGKRYIVPDYRVSPSFFDGSFNATKIQYTFNLSSFTQMYLEDKTGRIPMPELDLFFPEGEYKNVILKANHSSAKVRFEFTYTRF